MGPRRSGGLQRVRRRRRSLGPCPGRCDAGGAAHVRDPTAGSCDPARSCGLSMGAVGCPSFFLFCGLSVGCPPDHVPGQPRACPHMGRRTGEGGAGVFQVSGVSGVSGWSWFSGPGLGGLGSGRESPTHPTWCAGQHTACLCVWGVQIQVRDTLQGATRGCHGGHLTGHDLCGHTTVVEEGGCWGVPLPHTRWAVAPVVTLDRNRRSQDARHTPRQAARVVWPGVGPARDWERCRREVQWPPTSLAAGGWSWPQAAHRRTPAALSGAAGWCVTAQMDESFRW